MSTTARADQVRGAAQSQQPPAVAHLSGKQARERNTRMGLGGPQQWTPGFFFAWDMALFAFLLLAAFCFSSGVITGPPAGHSPLPVLGVLPYWVPWAGALGGVSISLVGVANHADQEWDSTRYAYWHLARPVLGAVFGTASVLIAVLFLKTFGPIEPTNLAPSAQQTAVLTVIAFVVGFREETFRTLLRRVVDVLVGPGAADDTSVVAFVPSEVNLGTITIGETAPVRTVHLFNGSTDTLHITQQHLIVGDPTLTVTVPAVTDLAPGQDLELQINWTPTTAGPLASNVSVATGPRTAQFAVFGTATSP